MLRIPIPGQRTVWETNVARLADTTKPVAMFIGGVPASGKSTLGAALARRISAALLDLDTITGPLSVIVCDLLGADDLSEPRVAALTRQARYASLLDTAAEVATGGVATVLVAPFTQEQHSEHWSVIHQRFSAFCTPMLIWLTLAPEEVLRRLVARGASRDGTKLTDPEGWLARMPSGPPTAPHLALDATEPIADLVDRIVAVSHQITTP